MIGLAQQHSFTTLTIQTNPPHSRLRNCQLRVYFQKSIHFQDTLQTKKVGDRPVLQNTAFKTYINKQEKVVPNHHIILIIYVKLDT
jgi:hypothetical protein